MIIGSVLKMMDDMSYHSGQLDKVEYFHWNDEDNFIVIIKLIFQKKTFVVLAKDDDSLELIQNTPQLPDFIDLTNVVVSDITPWKFAIGRHIRWVWMMINQQGYCDGFQFEFGNGDKNESIIIQLIAVASSIKVQIHSII